MTQTDLEDLAMVLPLADVEEFFRQQYAEIYLELGSYGIRHTHDGQRVMFQQSGFEHAFYTSSDQANLPHAKDILRKGSLKRMRWIGVLLAGEAPSSACFEIDDVRNPQLSPKRLYAHYGKPFVVWLEPHGVEGWRFSSAYPARIPQIYGYMRHARTIWKSK